MTVFIFFFSTINLQLNLYRFFFRVSQAVALSENLVGPSRYVLRGLNLFKLFLDITEGGGGGHAFCE